MPFMSYYLTPEGELSRDLGEERIKDDFESSQGLLWVDITETSEEDGEFLKRIFCFHPLAVEDCVSPLIHPPKIDDFGEYIFIVIHGINYTVESEIVETAALAIFPSPHLVAGSHNFPNIESKRKKLGI